MRLALIAFISILLVGCGSVTFKTSYAPDASRSYDEYFNQWLLVLGSATVSVDQACPGNRIAMIRNYISVEDILIGYLTSGIYTPRTTKVVCALEDKRAAN